ncbi:MAG: methyltransferase family protein [Candidatus Hodarchaeota archaeon]
MLTHFELLVSIVGAWIISAGLFIVLKQKRGNKLPPGSVVLETDNLSVDNALPGSRWSHMGVIIGMSTNSLILILVIFLSVFNYWEQIAPFITIDLPREVNWIGITGLWCQYLWGVAVLIYNVNYTPLTKPMKGNYVLATGGPYKIVRHPMYVGKATLTLWIFLATGVWLTIISLVGFLALPYQVKEEEKKLREIFGSIYDDYASRTGNLTPKIRLRRL